MFSDIFLPEKIGTKRILSKKVISFSIEDNVVKAALVYVKRSKTIIENLFEKPIESSNKNDFSQNASKAIKSILDQVKKYDQVKISIPSSMTTFKELSMPFTNKDKIKMILDYEIEPMLPFPIEDAISDFIITKQIKHKKTMTAQILACIVRKQDLQDILNLYYDAGIKPNNISVDLFSIYSVYQQIPEYNKLTNLTVFLDLGFSSTQIALLDDGQLRITRFIPNGIEKIIKNISKELNQSIENIQNTVFTQELRTLQQNDFDKSLQKQLIDLFNEIQFTLNSFSSKLNLKIGISKIFLMGKASQIKGLQRFASNLLQIPCENFKTDKIFTNNTFKNKVKKAITNWTNYIVPLGTSAPSGSQIDFNLQRKEFAIPNMTLLKKQIGTTIIIGCLIFGTILFNGYRQINKLLITSKNLENIQITRLKSILPKNSPTLKKTNFKTVLKETEKFVNEKTEIWAPLARQKVKPLEILQELTRIIDKRRFDVTIEQISIEDIENDSIKIEVDGFFKSKTGTKHFEAFRELEKRFDESGTLKLIEEIDARPSEDEGIKFNVKLKIKEF